MRSRKPHKGERSGTDCGVSALSYVEKRMCRLVKAAASNYDPLNKKPHLPGLKHPEHKATVLDADARQQTSTPMFGLVFKGILLHSSLFSNITVPSFNKQGLSQRFLS